jgi:hypothetical protein
MDIHSFFGFLAAFVFSVANLFGVSTSQMPSAPRALIQNVRTELAQPSQASISADLQHASETSGSAQAPNTTSSALPQGAPLQKTVSLGDGKYTTAGPKKGYIYICHVAQDGGGAQGSATWIHGSSWTPSEKISVEGSISWPTANYSMSDTSGMRHIVGNGLPTDHPTGIFPIQRSDPAYRFDGNPNSIKAQKYDFSLPISPTELPTPDCIFGQVGIMQDGVALFDGFDAEYRDAVAHETQDAWEAHPDKAGVYHYHGFESGYLNDAVSTVVGYAFDGFPITGGKLPDGNYVTSAELDECHGMTSTVELDGKVVTTYHYVLTQDFPYSVACFRGHSYEPKPGGQGSGSVGELQAQAASSPESSGGPPQTAIDACSGSSAGATCSFDAPKGTISVPQR